MKMNNKTITAALTVAIMAASSLTSSASDYSVDFGNIDRNCAVAGDEKSDLKYARELYEHGMYVKAREIFLSYPENPFANGYAVLCDIKMKSYAAQAAMEKYIEKYPYSGLVPQMKYADALNLFDIPDYPAASAEFSQIKAKSLYKSQLAEFRFKKAYADFQIGSVDSALEGFLEVSSLPKNDYQAPSAYSAAYIYYEREQFAEAEKWFAKSVKDPRFAEVSAYYILECRFMDKDYKYVTDNAEKIFASVPNERKPHLARIISESYLVQGDASAAKKYYDLTDTASGTRKDHFYAGSLLYALSDYKGAVENYSKMDDRSDSLGQIANYQMAYGYIKLKNKVAAMDAFKDAAYEEYDADIQEDAYFNYAKLAFDLNHDPSVFEQYIKKYPELAKGDRIYSYIALAALYNHDYAAAVEAYDNIDVLDKDMKANYMKANYLRAEQLISSGSYRKAIPCLKTAAYYSGKRSPFNQLSRYWLAESYYRSDDYAKAAEVYKTLYNNSALYGRPEGNLLPYDVAYCYFKSGAYPSSCEWFDVYLQSGDKSRRTDALTRKGDSYFIDKNYKDAIASYEAAIRSGGRANDLYPYYQAGLALSLTNKTKDEINLLAPVAQTAPTASFWSETVYELGRAYMADDDNANAAEIFKKLSSESRDSTYRARALIGLGMISANESQFDDALGYYKQVVSRMPSTVYSEDALRAIESIYQTKQEPEAYFAYLKTLDCQGTEGNEETMFFNAAEQIFLAENYQKAIKSLQAYLDEYPQGSNVNLAEFYMAESYKNIGKKEQACDWYKKVIECGETSFVEAASLSFAKLSYSIEHYNDAYSGYQSLLENAKIENNKHTAIVGMMNSAYNAKDYDAAVSNAVKVAADKRSDKDEVRHAQYIEAKSYLASSRRNEAFAILRKLSSQKSTPEGAEAAYLIIQDAYNQGKFDEVEKLVYAFSDAGSDQTYWLAKAFVTLGDSFAERDDMAQAKATFESVRDGYEPSGKNDDILDNVNMRLKKIAQREK